MPRPTKRAGREGRGVEVKFGYPGQHLGRERQRADHDTYVRRSCKVSRGSGLTESMYWLRVLPDAARETHLIRTTTSKPSAS
jgi:hypothetical protein